MNITEMLDEEFAESWRPEAGDTLSGTVVAIGMNDAGWGPYPIVTVQPDNGEPKAFHAFHSVAKARLAELRPEIGDKIGIRYLGLREPRNGGRAYHAYRIVMPGASGSVDWDAIAASPGVPVDQELSLQERKAREKAIERSRVREESPKAAARTSAAEPSDDIPF